MGYEVVKKPYAYIVLNKYKHMIGGTYKFSAAKKMAGERKKCAIAKVSKAWEYEEKKR